MSGILAMAEIKMLDLEDLHHFIPQVVDHLDRKAPGFRFRKRTGGIAIKNLSVNNINLQMHLAQRNDPGSEMVEREEAALKLLIAHQ